MPIPRPDRYHPSMALPVRPTLTVVVVAYAAGTAATRATVEACVRDTSWPHETIVLRNAAPALTADEINRWDLPVTVWDEPANLGYAGAINAALDRADTDLVMLLNDDATPEPDAFGALVAGFHPGEPAGERISAVCASVINAGEPEETKNGTLNLAGRIIPGRFADRHQVLYPSGAAMILRRDLPFRADPDTFLYYEDVFLGLTARLQGYSPVMAPAAKVRHLHHASMHTQEAGELAFLRERNRLLTLWTVFSDATLPKLEAYWRQERELLRVAALLGKETPRAVKQAERWMQEHRTVVLQKRAAVQASRTIEDEALLAYFSYRLLPAQVPGATLFNRRAKRFCEEHGLLTWDLREESGGRYALPEAVP